MSLGHDMETYMETTWNLFANDMERHVTYMETTFNLDYGNGMDMEAT